MIILFLFKIVALSSMVSALAAVVCVLLTEVHPSVLTAIVLFALLVTLRHTENIRRLLHGNENKIHWM